MERQDLVTKYLDRNFHTEGLIFFMKKNVPSVPLWMCDVFGGTLEENLKLFEQYLTSKFGRIYGIFHRERESLDCLYGVTWYRNNNPVYGVDAVKHAIKCHTIKCL